jgi:hypothetical protein
MKEQLNFTLYEIFGYLMPGAIATAALAIFLWAIFHGDSILPLSFWRLSPTGLLALLFVAYVLGHLVQALGNPLLKGAEKRLMSDENPAAVIAKHRLTQLIQGVAPTAVTIDYIWQQRVMDERCIQVGQQGDREIFTYREGFYRGSTVATALFCAGIAARMITGNLRLLIGDTVFSLSRYELGVLLAISALGVWGLYRRFQRFSEYRVARVIAAFIALP